MSAVAASALFFLMGAATETAQTVTWPAGAMGSVTFEPATATVKQIARTDGHRGGGPGPGSSGPGVAPLPIFAVKLWPSKPPFSSQARALPAAGWRFDVAASAPPVRLIYRYEDHDGVSLTATLLANLSAVTALELALELENAAASDGDALLVAEVAFPQLAGVTATSKGRQVNESELVSGGGVRGTGLRIYNPAGNLTHPLLRWYDHGYAPGAVQDVYPHSAMNWIGLADTTAAMYVGVHSEALVLTSLRLWNSSFHNGFHGGPACPPAPGFCISLTANSSAVLPAAGTGNSRTKPAIKWSRTIAIAIAIDPHGRTAFSHWSVAARIYRRWLESRFPAALQPAWATSGPVMGIDASGDGEYHGERETEIDDPWWFGSSHIIVWGTASVPQCCPGAVAALGHDQSISVLLLNRAPSTPSSRSALP